MKKIKILTAISGGAICTMIGYFVAHTTIMQAVIVFLGFAGMFWMLAVIVASAVDRDEQRKWRGTIRPDNWGFDKTYEE